MQNQFKKLLQMMEKAGNKLVLFDADSEESYILLPLSEYQNLLNSSVPAPKDSKMEEFELAKPMKEVSQHYPPSNKVKKAESELIPGISTEVVEIEGQKEEERDEEGEEKFYFEALKTESESEPKLLNEIDKE